MNLFFLSQYWITASLLFPTLPRNLWKLFSPFSHEFQYNVMSPLWLLQLCLARTWLRSNRASKDDWEKGLDSLSGYVRRAKSVLILKGDNLRIQGIHPVSLQKPNLKNSWTKFKKMPLTCFVPTLCLKQRTNQPLFEQRLIDSFKKN